MKKKSLMRFFVFVLMIALIVPSVTVSAAGYEYTQNVGGSNVYVHDFADLLTASEEEFLVDLIADECYDVHYNVLFLTTNYADGKSTMVYSDDYMDELFPVDENNIAFIIDMDNREIYINTMGNAILCLTDNMIDKALDNGYDYIVDGDYYECMNAMATYCVSRLTDAPGSGAVNTIKDIGVFEVLFTQMFLMMAYALAPTVLVIIVLIVRHNKANKKTSAVNYVAKDNYSVIDKDEIFVRSYETVHRDYYKQSSSGSSGGGGGSSHSSSSGRSHGGGGRSF